MSQVSSAFLNKPSQCTSSSRLSANSPSRLERRRSSEKVSMCLSASLTSDRSESGRSRANGRLRRIKFFVMPLRLARGRFSGIISRKLSREGPLSNAESDGSIAFAQRSRRHPLNLGKTSSSTMSARKLATAGH